MKTATKRILMTTAAVAVMAGLGMAAVHSGAEARGWGDGSGAGFHQGMGGGPCAQGPMQGRMSGGPGGGRGGSMLEVMDADADGTVTRAEFERFHDLGFAAMDADGDGEVTRQDFIDGRQPAFAGGNGQGRRGNSEARAERRAERLGQRFDVWDANTDGIVTADEFKAASATRFEGLDLDGNNAVEKQEVAAAMMFGPRGSMMGR